MLPKESTAGLATGCRFSAIWMPMSQLQASLDLLAVAHHQFAGGGALRHLDDHQRIGADDDRRGYVADGDARPVDGIARGPCRGCTIRRRRSRLRAEPGRFEACRWNLCGCAIV